MKKTQITTIIAILLLATIATAYDWQQLPGSPTANSIKKIRVYGTNAMLIDSANLAYYYTGGAWTPVATPSNKPTGVTFSANFDVNTAGNWYWAFSNTTEIKIYKFNFINASFGNAIQTITPNATFTAEQAVICHYVGANTCYATRISGSSTSERFLHGITETGASDIDMLNTNVASLYAYNSPYITLQYNTGTIALYRWNGASWVSQAGGLSSTVYKEYDSNHRWYLASLGLFIWNSTSNSYNFLTYAIQQYNDIIIQPESLGLYGVNAYATTQLRHLPYYTAINGSTDATIGALTLTTGFIDEKSMNGWLGLSNGNLYFYTGTNPNSTNNLYYTISSNPSIYGQNVIVTAIPSSELNQQAHILIDFYNTTGSSVYGAEFYTTNQEVFTTIDTNSWTNFEIGQTYNVVFDATFTNGDHIEKTISWSVIQNTTTNTTQYEATAYQTTGYTNVVAIDNKGANNIFATAKTLNQMKILTFDVTNPTSIITKEQNITTTGNTPTSLNLGTTTRLYLGTDNKLTTLNGTEYADATQLTQNSPDAGFAFLTKPYVYDTLAIDDDLAWVCNDGYISDEARLYNYTSNSMTDTISENPCLSIVSQGDLLIIHKGTSGIKIYNATTQTLITTITGITTQPSGATHDRLSTYGNYLFAITGQTQVTKYDITNPASPVKIDDCYTNNEAKSIEALSTTEVIVGTNSNLRVCDYANTEKLDQISQKYTSTTIKTYLNNENPTEIIELDTDGKFAVAEGAGIGIYYYSKTTQQTTTNNPPTINTIATSTDTPCINQTITATIEATDIENDALTYDYDCNGIKTSMTNNYIGNTFTCAYTSTGSKTIKTWARDASTTPVQKTKTITVTNCTNNNYLNFKIYDYDNPSTPLQGVLVNIIGQTSGVTNTAGLISFNLATAGTYQVTFSKSGYQSQTKSYQTYNGDYLLYLRNNNLPSGAQRNILQAIITDSNNNPLENALFTSTDPITAIAQTATSDFIGTAILNDVPAQVPLRISAGKNGYVSQFSEVTVQQGETKTVSFQLLRTGQTANASTTRACKDPLDSVWLCSPLNTTGDGDNCQTDADCLSGRCMPSPSNTRSCSIFNWSQCDSIGYPRGNQCFLKFTAEGTAGGFTDVIMDNFLYVLIFVALLIMGLLVVRSVNKY